MNSILARLVSVAGVIFLLSACASSRALDDTVSDITTNAEIKGVIFKDRTHDYSDIDLTVFEGRLLLTGTMHTQEGLNKLVENAWSVGGLDQLIDAVIVGGRTSFREGLEDTRIDQTLHARLIAAKNIRSGEYKIAVSQSAIHLIGSTRTKAELDETLEIARSIRGVKQVVHYVTIRTQTNAPVSLTRN